MATNLLPKGGDRFLGGIETNEEEPMPGVDGQCGNKQNGEMKGEKT